jgi:Trk K+ transport system NAD-binding subunit
MFQPTAAHDHYNAITQDYDIRIERLQRRRHSLWRLIRASIWDFFLLVRDAWISLVGFAFVTAVSTLYLLYGYRDPDSTSVSPFSVDTALHETIRLMALESDLPLPTHDLFGEILFFIIPVLGLALVFQSVLNFSRLLLDKSSRIEAWQISLARTCRNHIILTGLGSVSYRVTIQLLEAGYDVVIIERDWESEFVSAALELKVPIILGDARQASILRQAGIHGAHSMITATHDDLINIEIALAARRRRDDLPIVLRIFHDELDTNLEYRFGRNSAFSASALAAPMLATAAIGRSIAHVLPLPEGFATGEHAATTLGILQLTIRRNSPLCMAAQVAEEHYGIRILRHLGPRGSAKPQRKGHQPAATLAPDDIVVFLGPLTVLEVLRTQNEQQSTPDIADSQLRVFSREPLPGHARAYDTVIVCGLGKVGYRIVQALAQLEPRPTIVIVCLEHDTPEPFIETAQALGLRIIFGDARRTTILQAAGSDSACSVVAVTSDDLINMQIGLAAHKLSQDIDLVLRVFSDTLAERLSVLFGVHTAFSIAALAAPTLAAAAVVPGIDYAIELGEQILSTATLIVRPDDPFANQSISEMLQRHTLLVIALRRQGQPMLTLSRDTRLVVGDEFVVLADIRTLLQSGKGAIY